MLGPSWESLDIPFKPSQEAFHSWLDSEVDLFFRMVSSGKRGRHCADSPDGQHQLQMDTEHCRYCGKEWVADLGYAAPVALGPRMMDAQARSCPSSGDGFHWVEISGCCRVCGNSCAPLPDYAVDQAVVDEINAGITARLRGW